MFTKRFCCSNNAATVAKMLAVTDMVFSILMIFLLSSFVHISINYPQTLRTMINEIPEKQEDLRKFLAWGPYKKALLLSVPFVGSFCNGFKGILLFFGAARRSYPSIRLWLILTFTFLMTGLLGFVAEVIFTQDKGLLVCLSLLDWIYEAYSIWIVKNLFFELMAEAKTKAINNQSHETMETKLSPTPSSAKSHNSMDPEIAEPPFSIETENETNENVDQ